MRVRFALLPLCAFVLQAAQPLDGVIVPFRQMELPAPVSSRISELKVKEGDRVKAGQPLVLLDARIENLEMQQAKLLLERREYSAKGAKKLAADRVIAEAEALEVRTELELARLHFELASEQVKLRTLSAPFEGQVVALLRELGEAVGGGQTVLRIADLRQVYVQGALRAEQAARLGPGTKLTVRFPQLPSEPPRTGELVQVDACADADGLFRVKVLLDNPEQHLRPGFRALVDLP